MTALLFFGLLVVLAIIVAVLVARTRSLAQPTPNASEFHKGLFIKGYQHPPFGQEVRAILQEIEAALIEVHPLTLEQWEDGFRRDAHPGAEIAIWRHIARIYRETVSAQNFTRAQKQELYSVLLCCTFSATADGALSGVNVKSLSRGLAESLVKAYFGDAPPFQAIVLGTDVPPDAQRIEDAPFWPGHSPALGDGRKR